ncbi:MAG: PA14 domain-containing protein [Planctomycetota bacterium]
MRKDPEKSCSVSFFTCIAAAALLNAVAAGEALYRPAENPSHTEPGLRYHYFTGQWTQLPEFGTLGPAAKGFISNFDITGAATTDHFGFSFTGYIDIATQGTYTFYTASDDGSELYIGGNLVVDNNGSHTLAEASGSINLEAGKHAIRVNYFDGTGPQELTVSYEGPGISKIVLPSSVLYREILPGDVNDDGKADLCDLAAIGEQWLTVYGLTDVQRLADNWLEGNMGLQVNDGWLTIDGEKFFVKGIGYEDIRPGYDPWTQPFDPAMITLDMNRILDGRFNTIRTWAALPEAKLQLIDSLGLKIIFGIWIQPNADYGSPAFITSVENDVRNTLAYSKNYDSIITYVIMNEPQPDDIHAGGAAALAALWDRIKTIIHTAHPGIPVSFANTGWSKFIDMNAFDVSVYNLYMYGPSVKHSFGYAGWVEAYKNAAPDNPFIVSEYGLSVSPSGPGNYGYGGNTLTEQTDGNLHMYRSLIDGGGQGGCVFNYSDGWWKGADPGTHDDHVEEWFGLVHFDASPPADTEGTPRPAWEAYKSYNACIITSPKNGQIYDAKVPLEFFPHSDVNTIRIKKDAAIVYNKPTNGRSYIEDTLTLSIVETIKDIELQFEFLDHTDTVIKTETIVLLYAQTPPALPDFTFEVPLDDLNNSSTCDLQMSVDNPSVFTIKDDTIDYSFYPHSWVDARTADLNKILLNGDFSTGGSSWSIIDGGVYADLGDNALKVWATGGLHDIGFAVQEVEATPGQTYTLSADVWNSSDEPLPVTGGEAFIKLEFYDGTGTILNGPWGTQLDIINGTAAQDTWIPLSGSMVAPAGSATVKVIPMVQDTGGGVSVAWFDNVSLTTNPMPTVMTYNDIFTIPAETDMLTVSAGMTLQYGQFEKRLTRQKEIQRGTWANPICRKNTRNIQSE